MGRITVRVADETLARFRKAAAEKFKNRKGYLKAAMAEAVKSWVEEKEQNNANKYR